jgi:hypothetical protein
MAHPALRLDLPLFRGHAKRLPGCLTGTGWAVADWPPKVSHSFRRLDRHVSGWGEMHFVPARRRARADEVPVGSGLNGSFGKRYAAAGVMLTSKPRSSILR